VRRLGIQARIVLLTSAVAAIAVIVAGLVSFPLVRSNAQALAEADLAQLADLTATTLHVDADGEYSLPRRVADVLQSEQVRAYVFGAGATDLPEGVTTANVEAVTSGTPFTATADTGQGALLIVGRPYEPGTGVVLIQPSNIAGNSAGDVLERLAVALLIGGPLVINRSNTEFRRRDRSRWHGTDRRQGECDGCESTGTEHGAPEPRAVHRGHPAS